MTDLTSPAVVTVDGTAGSGKSTLGRRLAQALDLPFLDSGLFYRAVTATAARAGLTDTDREALTALARSIRVDVGTDANDQPRVHVDGVAIPASELHDPLRAQLLAAVSSTPGIRAALLPAQRALARSGLVAVGRDCGTVVFPDAALKIYLEASESVRTSRRASQLRRRGASVDVAVLDQEVSERDAADSTRAVAPLRRAADACVIDTGALGVDAMVATALGWCRERGLLR